MRDANSRREILIALILAGLGALVACGASKSQPSNTTKPPVEHIVELKKAKNVRVATVKRGEAVKFVAANLTVFIMY